MSSEGITAVYAVMLSPQISGLSYDAGNNE